MKAIRVHSFGLPDVLRLEDTPDVAPAPGQVLIRVKAVGINPVETYIRAGNYGPMKFPFTLGNDSAGVVEAVAADIKHFKKGDRVYTDKTISGSYAELTVADANYVHPLPDGVTFQQGAAVGTPGGTAYRGLFQRGRGKPDEAVLIHGATGGVGSAAVQLARAAGMYVVATSSSERGREFALEQGAHHATDHDVVQRLDEVRSLTDGKGFDLIIETAAHKNLGADLPALTKGGRVVVIGSRGKVEIDARDTMSREADILGLMLFGATPAEHRAMYSALSAGMENGTFRPIVGLELPLADAAKAHTLVTEGDQFGKIVLTT
jgi:NADPH2:quinone reductase